MQVTYKTETFLDKNRDYVVVEHRNLMSSSKCSLVAGLFSSMPEESSRSSYKFSSVSSRFKVWHFLYLSFFLFYFFPTRLVPHNFQNFVLTMFQNKFGLFLETGWFHGVVLV